MSPSFFILLALILLNKFLLFFCSTAFSKVFRKRKKKTILEHLFVCMWVREYQNTGGLYKFLDLPDLSFI